MMDSDMEEKTEINTPHLSDKALLLLSQFRKVWDKMKKEPDGSYPTQNYMIHLPPSPLRYWNYLKEIESILIELQQELPDEYQFDIYGFLFSKNKEGKDIQNFEWNKKWNQQKYINKLSKLMNDFNDRIYRDLIQIFNLIDNINNSNI